MSTLNLHARLKSLSDALRAVSSLIARLARLASSPGTATPQQQSDDSPERTELAAEIQASLKELEQEFELVRQDAEDVAASGTTLSWGTGSSQHRRRDSEKDRERVAIATQVERVGEDLKLYALFRNFPTLRSCYAAVGRSRIDKASNFPPSIVPVPNSTKPNSPPPAPPSSTPTPAPSATAKPSSRPPPTPRRATSGAARTSSRATSSRSARRVT